MRDLTKSDYYWGRAMEEAVRHGYEEFAMTLNPFPGATEKALEYAKMARAKGFKFINVTATLQAVYNYEEGEFVPFGRELLDQVNVLSISVDEHRFKNASIMVAEISSFDDELDEINFYARGKQLNINLLWTPKVFEWFSNEALDEMVGNMIEWREDEDGLTFQHLILKPLSLYPSQEWLYKNYQDVVATSTNITIQGNNGNQIGDAAFHNMLGMNQCPGKMMVDIDPMGFARKCPENPDAYDATTIAKLQEIFTSGVPNCGSSKCNCIL
tara:strand:- start:1264 stop:2073 length:810 start_codon:yes stop_codon:yes gene_type:complete